jgi:hypothetical protein
MKMKLSLLAIVGSFQLFANTTVKTISEEGTRIGYEVAAGMRQESELFDFYEREVGALDVETLQKNPELVFRRGLTRLAVFFDLLSIDQARNFLEDIHRDFSFVLSYAPKESRYYRAAAFQVQVSRFLLDSEFQSWEEFGGALEVFFEQVLRKWAKNPVNTGRALREDVYENLLSSKEAFDSFAEFVMIVNDDPEFLLSDIEPDVVEILGVSEDGVLGFRLRYSRSPCLKFLEEMGI